MSYEVLFKCPFCETDTAGNHAWNCPNNPNNYYSYEPMREFPYTTTDNTLNTEEDILYKLKMSGQRLKQILNITEEDIDRAIKELRRDW